jgi:two-component system response regulator EvgA
MKALVIDDAPMVRTRVAALLREVSCEIEVREASDAREAFAAIDASCPDLVILDIHLPGTNGLQLLPRLTQLPRPPVIVVLTNDPSEQHRQQCLALGASHFLDKSVDIDRLVDVVAESVESQSPTNA